MSNKIFGFFVVLAIMSSTVSCGQESSKKTSSNSTGQEVKWLASFQPFESVLKISSDFKQVNAPQDFNGDENPDYIYFSEVVSESMDVPDGVRVVHLFGDGGDFTNLSDGSNNAIAIVHGGIDEKIIIHDPEVVSYLDSPAIVDAFVVDKKYIDSIESPGPLSSAKGNIIVLPTAAGIDTYVYFDGEHYKIYEPLEIP